MKDAVICKVCRQPFSYERKYRPRIYCDTCRGPAYKAHATAPYDADYQRRYNERVRKPRKMARAAMAQDSHKASEGPNNG